jgi:3-keto-disaccharide hydrolase
MRFSHSSILALIAASLVSTVAPPAIAADTPPAASDEAGFISLFDGKSLDGWRASEHRDSCKVANGEILMGGGERSHLFYNGPVHDHDFKNFELRLEVMTEPHSNSGVYFHTQYQETDWPAKGYEAQINNSHEDWRRTGSLYAVKDVDTTPVKDGEWFDYDIRVDGKQITLKVNGQTIVDYTEPANPPQPDPTRDRRLSHGTIALQAHDPGSLVHFRNIRIKPLPDE